MNPIVADDTREVESDWRENGEDAGMDAWLEATMQRLCEVTPEPERKAA